jgi:hypothetical protein
MDDVNTRSVDFNQSCLQDFVECPRRFELGTLHDSPWPSAHSAPLSKYESLTEIGNHFHQLCQQFFIGIDAALISSSISDPDLLHLWQSFLPYGQAFLNYPIFFEQILRTPYENHFLLAKFDLIVQLTDDEFLIIDWKTSHKKPSKTMLSSRVQTFLYPFIFQQAGGDLFAKDVILPPSITMQYFYPLSEEPEEIFPYSQAKHLEVSGQIAGLIAEINNFIASRDPFPLTEDPGKCVYCRYRSLCERDYQTKAVPPGADLESEDLSSVHYDLEQIKEIEF